MANKDNLGIKCWQDDLINWTCSMDVYKTIWINSSSKDAKSFLQDAVSWATYFIWTVVFVSLLVSWLMLIFSAGDEKLAEKWKMWVKYSVIWLFLVISSYAIIKLVQYVMRW